MPNLLGSVCGTAGRVDAQHDGLHIVIVGQFLQFLADFRSHDVVVLTGDARRLRVYDFAVGIVHGYLVAILLFALDADHFVQRQLVYAIVLINLQQFLDLTFHLVGEHQLVHQLQLHQLLGVGEGDAAVGVGVQRVYADLTTLRHVVEYHLPDAVHVGCYLFAVGLTHLVGCHHFRGALVFAYLH